MCTMRTRKKRGKLRQPVRRCRYEVDPANFFARPILVPLLVTHFTSRDAIRDRIYNRDIYRVTDVTGNNPANFSTPRRWLGLLGARVSNTHFRDEWRRRRRRLTNVGPAWRLTTATTATTATSGDVDGALTWLTWFCLHPWIPWHVWRTASTTLDRLALTLALVTPRLSRRNRKSHDPHPKIPSRSENTDTSLIIWPPPPVRPSVRARCAREAPKRWFNGLGRDNEGKNEHESRTRRRCVAHCLENSRDIRLAAFSTSA